MAGPTIQKMVYNRIPFLVDNEANQGLISDWKIEYFYELQNPLEHTEFTPEQVESEESYTVPERSLVADLVCVSLLTRRVLSNMEGSEGSAAVAGKTLTKTKAGSAEAEWQPAKASDGTKLLMTSEKLLAYYKAEAIRRAASLGFLININESGQMLIDSFSGGTTFRAISWGDDDC